MLNKTMKIPPLPVMISTRDTSVTFAADWLMKNSKNDGYGEHSEGLTVTPS